MLSLREELSSILEGQTKEKEIAIDTPTRTR